MFASTVSLSASRSSAVGQKIKLPGLQTVSRACFPLSQSRSLEKRSRSAGNGDHVVWSARNRLLAIERLNLAFLIDAEDKGSAGIGKGRPYRVPIDEQQIARQLECLATVRLQSERRPHSADHAVGKTSFRSHRSGLTSASRRWRRPQRSFEDRGNLIFVDGARAARAGFVRQAITAILQNRRRHLPTVASWRPSSAATDLLGKPSAHRAIARHRSDSDQAKR